VLAWVAAVVAVLVTLSRLLPMARPARWD